MRGVGHEDDDAEVTEEARRGAADGAGGPLALSFQAEVRAGLLEGDFDVRPLEVGREDRESIDLLVGAEERIRRESALVVAHQDPANAQRDAAIGVPERGAGSHVMQAQLLAVPGDDLPLPGGVADRGGGGVQSVNQLGLARPLLRLDPRGARRPNAWRIVQLGVEHQAGHQPHASRPQTWQAAGPRSRYPRPSG